MLLHAIAGWWMIPAVISLLTWLYVKLLNYLPHSILMLVIGVGMMLTSFASWLIYAWWFGYLFWWNWIF